MLRITNDIRRVYMPNKIEHLLALSQSVAEYLQQNFHPHTTVVIEVDSIRVEETLAGKVIEYERN